jgi:hypothetical protein
MATLQGGRTLYRSSFLDPDANGSGKRRGALVWQRGWRKEFKMDSPIDSKKMAKRSLESRRVFATGERGQLVLMSIPAGEEIGSEVHPTRIRSCSCFDGQGRTVVNGQGLAARG